MGYTSGGGGASFTSLIQVLDADPVSWSEGQMWALRTLPFSALPFSDGFSGTDGESINRNGFWPTILKFTTVAGEIDTVNSNAVIQSNQAKFNIVATGTATNIIGVIAASAPVLDFSGGKKYRITAKLKYNGATHKGIAFIPSLNVAAVNPVSTAIQNSVVFFMYSTGITTLRKITAGVQDYSTNYDTITDANMHTFVLECSSASVKATIDGVSKRDAADVTPLTGDVKVILFAEGTVNSATDYFDDVLIEQVA